MKETIIEKYALTVCFVFLICMVIALGIGIYDIVEIVSLESTIHTCEDAAQSLTKVIIIVLLCSIVFFIHWRIAKRARAGEANNG